MANLLQIMLPFMENNGTSIRISFVWFKPWHCSCS